MAAIQITVNLYATLTKFHPAGKGMEAFTVTLGEGATVGDLIIKLSLPEEEVKQIFLNSRRADKETPLQDGQRVAIFPPLAGG